MKSKLLFIILIFSSNMIAKQADFSKNIVEAQPITHLQGQQLDKNQLANIKFIWKHLANWKEEVNKGDLGRWVIAISWVESQLGKAMVNMQTYDCGLFHANVKYYLVKHKIKDTPLMRNTYCSTLITNRELALSHTLETLYHFKQYWEKRGHNTTALHRAIMSYNVGYWKAGGTLEKIGLAYFKKVLKVYEELEQKHLELQALIIFE